MSEIINGALHVDGMGYLPADVELTESTNNANLNTMSSSIKLNNTSGGSIDLTGILYNEEETDGYEHIYNLKNVSINDIVIKHNSLLSDLGNRFITKGGVDVTLSQGESIRVSHQNDASGNGWFEFS